MCVCVHVCVCNMFALHTHRRQARMAGASDQGFFVHSSGAHASTRRYRARVLAEWLVDTWGVSALSQGSGVLDVAGGSAGCGWWEGGAEL